MSRSDRNEEFAVSVLEQLRKAGFEAFFAGGCVRDRLLGRTPKDYDIATSALPEQTKELFSRIVDVGEAFRVIRVVDESDPQWQVEVASFRKDVGVADGRHPARVEVATKEEDVERRDFTINGMLYDPLEDQLIDLVGGEQDLKEKTIRAIGDPRLRLKEDYLRMLRAVRFAARFDYKINPSLQGAVRENTAHIHKISSERIYDELTRMLTEGRAHQAFETLADLGLLKEIMPELLDMKGCEQAPEHHPEGDVWVHTMLLLKQLTPEHDPRLAWGCLLHDIAKPATYSKEEGDRIRFSGHAHLGAQMSDKILKGLKASKKTIETVHALVKDHLKFADIKNMRESTLKRFLRQDDFDLHLEQHRIDCMASHQKLELYEFCKAKLAELKTEELKPTPFLSGKDLIKYGLSPGPKFKEILSQAEDLQLEGQFKTRESALEWLESIKKD